MTQEATDFVRIGAGSFATIYVWQGRNNVALKCVADSERLDELLAEFQLHEELCKSANGLLFQIPESQLYYSSYSKFKADMFLSTDFLGSTECIYTMERVWPIPPLLRSQIIASYSPEDQKAYEKHFIARVYLGRDPERNKALSRSRFFNANNFPLDAERCEHLQLPARLIAEDMGRLLARIHFVAERSCLLEGTDGRDIEFVLGGHRKRTLTEHGLFVFDFNQVKAHSKSAEALVDSFFANDPYYPRPRMRYWADFKDGYLSEVGQAPDASTAILIAGEVIKAIEEKVASSTASAIPEGRGMEMAELDERLR